jgi:hypothetical protein
MGMTTMNTRRIMRHVTKATESLCQQPTLAGRELIGIQVDAGRVVCKMGYSPEQVAEALSLSVVAYRALRSWYRAWVK